jgi:branched-chain amino acid transport system substrate-binding protein
MKRRLIAVAPAAGCFLLALVVASGGAAKGRGAAPLKGSTELGSKAQKNPITIGAAVGLSGFIAAYDGPPLNAARLAIRDLNKKGGLLGRQVKLVTADTKSKTTEGAKASLAVIAKGAQMVIVTCDFDYGSPAATIAQSKGLISWSLCAGSPRFGPKGIGPYAYTMGTAANTEGAVLAHYAVKNLKYRNAYILLDNTLDFEIQIVNGFKQQFKVDKGKIVGQDTFQNQDPSIASQITRLRKALTGPPATRPNFILMCSYQPGVAAALRQLRASGVKLPILGTDDLDGTYWLKSVPHLSNVYYATFTSIFGDDPDPAVNAFVTKYKKFAGSAPPTAYTVLGYTLIQAYAAAVKRAGTTDTKAVVAQLNKFRKVPLLGGPVTFTDNVHIRVTRPMRVLKFTNSKPRFVTIGKTTITPKLPT